MVRAGDRWRERLRGKSGVVLLCLILAACTSIGPSTVPRDRVDYSNALSDSWKDQMLLNIVRLRYADTPTFMDVSSVISAYTIQGAAQAGGTINVGVPNNTTITPMEPAPSPSRVATTTAQRSPTRP